MSGFDKIIKGACKPKAAPPKSKYVEPLIAATWSEDGAVGDVCKALSPKFKEPNAIVVFKALIVLHMLIRNGATDNILSYLSNTDVLRLKNVGGGHWEGYNAPQNLQHYAIYLDTRIRAYREMKHDAIRVQSETNRDARLSAAIDDDNIANGRPAKRDRGGATSASVQRSKTTAGRKLRVMSVEKGLLREMRAVQKQIDALVECRFFLENLEDDLTITALRMLVKDIVILFQAGNEGMVNLLEHFFEMSHVDAERALSLYRHFCKQTERVVEYLSVAKKLQNLLNVPIPNMKHAPVSLAGALEEYLTDPNFEQNRIEYKAQKDAADKNAKAGNRGLAPKTEDKASTSNVSSSVTPSSSNETVKPESKQAVIDFFSAIEEEQQTMFNPQTGSPTSTYFQQQASHNPFQMQMQQMTGAFPSQPFGQPSQPFSQPAQPQMQMQPTGFIQPQQTAFQMPLQAQATGTNPFGMGMQNQQQQQQPSFLRPQTTGFLQPQMTGANPFRQSVMMPQSTGMHQFPTSNGMPNFMNSNTPSTNAFQPQQHQQSPPFPPTPVSATSSMSSATSSTFSTSPSFAAPTAQQPNAYGMNNANLPARPATAPGPKAQTSTTPQPVKSHQTGSRNPFGVPVTPAPPVPQPPTLMELMMGSRSGGAGTPQEGQQQQPQAQPNGGLNGNNLQQSQGADMASVASSFSSLKIGENKTGLSGLPSLNPSSPFGASPLSAQNTSTSSSTFSSFLSSQPTGATVTSMTSSTPSLSASSPSLKPQTTGFPGIKQFKPSSSFGAQLLDSLPPIPQSAPTTPNGDNPPSLSSPTGTGAGTSSRPFSSSLTGLSSQPTGFSGLSGQPTGAAGGFSSFGNLGSTGSTVGVGLRPQMTGAAGAANPFRATMFSATSAPGNTFGGTPSFQTSTPTGGAFSSSGLGSSLFSQQTGAPTSSFGSSLFGNTGAPAQSPPTQPQQTQQTSLI
ncbi:ANTH-domain-containing protein [Heliocybe sulcata]|uniref:ANTH-domain-containing protein n=1 Tax=Heliocybe sulcata TaxID=5364 RepID=A0A5C3N2E9_9AGAM|nr:ANTH-domain-containing protein [Heliocybe sulcata]